MLRRAAPIPGSKLHKNQWHKPSQIFWLSPPTNHRNSTKGSFTTGNPSKAWCLHATHLRAWQSLLVPQVTMRERRNLEADWSHLNASTGHKGEWQRCRWGKVSGWPVPPPPSQLPLSLSFSDTKQLTSHQHPLFHSSSQQFFFRSVACLLEWHRNCISVTNKMLLNFL